MMIKIAFVFFLALIVSVSSSSSTCGFECRRRGFGPCVDFNRGECSSCCPNTCTGGSQLRCSVSDGTPSTLIFRTDAIIFSNFIIITQRDVDLFDAENGSNSSNNNAADEAAYGHCKFCEQVSFEAKISQPDTVAIVGDDAMNPCRENATGLLCSRCDSDTYHNRKGDCVSCSNPGLSWFIFILIEIVPITILFIILYITGFNLVSGGLNSAIFFAQMITTTMDITGDGFIPISNITNNSQTSASLIGAYHFLYEPWNLEFFAPFSRNLCLFHAESFLVYFLVEYIIAFYPILLLVGVVAIRAVYSKLPESCPSKRSQSCTKLFKCNQPNQRDANHDLTVSVLVLSYSKLAITSASLVSGVWLHDSDGGFVRFVSLNDPSTNYVSFPYLLFVIIALVILILLFTYPFLILIVMYLRDFKKSKRFSFLDTLVSPFRQLKNNDDVPRSKLDKSFSVFRDRRWIETVYLILRVVLLIIYIIPSLPFIKKYTIEQGILLVGMMFVVFVHPYELKAWLGRIDLFFLLLLAFINTLSIYQYSLTQSSLPLAVSTFVVQYILIFVPAVWMIGYIFARVFLWLKSPITGNARSMNRRGSRYDASSNDKAGNNAAGSEDHRMVESSSSSKYEACDN